MPNKYSFNPNQSCHNPDQYYLKENDLNAQACEIFSAALRKGYLVQIKTLFNELTDKQILGLINLWIDYQKSLVITLYGIMAPYGRSKDLAKHFGWQDIYQFLLSEEHLLLYKQQRKHTFFDSAAKNQYGLKITAFDAIFSSHSNQQTNSGQHRELLNLENPSETSPMRYKIDSKPGYEVYNVSRIVWEFFEKEPGLGTAYLLQISNDYHRESVCSMINTYFLATAPLIKFYRDTKGLSLSDLLQYDSYAIRDLACHDENFKFLKWVAENNLTIPDNLIGYHSSSLTFFLSNEGFNYLKQQLLKYPKEEWQQRFNEVAQLDTYQLQKELRQSASVSDTFQDYPLSLHREQQRLFLSQRNYGTSDYQRLNEEEPNSQGQNPWCCFM